MTLWSVREVRSGRSRSGSKEYYVMKNLAVLDCVFLNRNKAQRLVLY